MTDHAATPQTRVFVIGGVRIVEDASMAGKSTPEIQKMLTPLYPQIENATVRERTDEATGMTIIEWIQRAGRKG
ncbi:MAG: hypothetical protein BroJett018_22240 [Chloroflexota bacterium]|nr:hypothetical protein [Chloroflexota bacterium]NOG66123.1 hypothetical protein [Chloroflexota bacterium]GIK64430.1 MAG: hypothetical protein BroJett018_22240 [Chloroflexota bacterium]